MSGSKPFTEEDIYKLLEYAKSFDIKLVGPCYDCGKDVSVSIVIDPDSGLYTVEGGALWKDDVDVDGKKYDKE